MPELRAALIERLRFLAEIGVDALPRSRPAAVEVAPGAAIATTVPPGRPSPAADALAALRERIGDCHLCRLSASRSRIVFGVGNPDADLMFIGEAPGRDEDLQGEPFVGKAGQLLDRMIAAIGWRREDVYIANIVKCRPPDNRNPQADEMEACADFLRAQIDAVAPRVIVALGKFATGALLGAEVAITRARGQFRLVRGVPVMPTFHPAFLLRQYTAENRRLVYEDLLQVQAMLETPRPDL